MKKRIFPRIYYSAGCSAFLLSVVALLGSTFVLAHTPDTNTIDTAAAAQWQAGGQRVQLEGELEIVHQDYKDGHGQFVYSLKTADGTRVPLQFVKHPPTHLLTGDHVRANGQLSGGSLILYSGSTNLTKTTAANGKTQPPPPPTSSIPVPNTFGSQSVLVILVNFQDEATQPYAVSDVQNAFFTTANSFVAENSYGQTSLTGDVVGWYTIPDSVTSCNFSQMATDAQNAATTAGVNLSSYTRYVYLFAYDATCGFSGASQVGGNPSQSWINGTLNPYVIHHELGHAFGLWHSHLYDCGTSATICSSPNVVEYGDPLDVMGTPQSASPGYNAFQKERLGWLGYGASPSIQTVTTSGTYTINPYETSGPGPNALKVLKSTDPTTGAKTWYYLEQRQAIGFDAFLTSIYTQNETTGVLFHLGTDGDGGTSDLLDMTPATPTLSGWGDMSLVAGQSFQDSTAGVTFAPTAVSSSGATVQITMNGNGSACTAANPTVSVSPSQSQSVTSGTAVNFTATVTDKDSSGCSAATFNLGDALPSGWAGVWSAAALSLSPGKSGSATLTVTSPAGTADGSYNVGVNATNASASSYSGSATATYLINTAPLSVSLTTNQSSYLPGQTVGINVSLLYGTLPDAGARVTLTVTAPSGRTTTLSSTSDSNGVAYLSYNLSKHATAGTYQVQLGTTVTGASPIAGASTTFTVQ
jgi:Gametolysin peptidase M11/NPCBM-associated, NEW3 domain of alpha-galactosidase